MLSRSPLRFCRSGVPASCFWSRVPFLTGAIGCKNHSWGEPLAFVSDKNGGESHTDVSKFTFEAARPALVEKLTKSLAGILYIRWK